MLTQAQETVLEVLDIVEGWNKINIYCDTDKTMHELIFKVSSICVQKRMQ